MDINSIDDDDDDDDNLKEEKMLANLTKKEVPHWLRRQIGSVLPSWRNHSRKDWYVNRHRV